MVVRLLTLNICIEAANGEIPMSYLSGSDLKPIKKSSFGSEQGFEPGSLTFSGSTMITGPVIHLQIFVSSSASVRTSAGFVLLVFLVLFFINQYS